MQHRYIALLKRLVHPLLLGILIQCLFVASTFALDGTDYSQQQPITVSGTVTASDEGGALPGVNVVIRGTTQGATTDADGKYTLQVSDPDAVLVFSFIGYATQEIPIAAKSVIDVVLVSDAKQLGEVVVVAYGTQKKTSLTGAVSAVSNQEIITTKNENVQDVPFEEVNDDKK